MPSRRRQKAVRSTDPGQSAWWLLPSAGGIIAGGIGAVASQTLTHNAVGSAMVGAVSGAVAGLGAATPQFRDWVSARSHTQQIAKSAGFPTNINSEPLESLRVHNSDRDITEFVPRDIQNQLVKHLNNGTPVLIEGPSMSGKTRLALEIIRSHWPEAPFWFPRDDGDIEKLLNSNQQPPANTIILLDDLDRFLSNQSLTLGLLNQWTNNSCTIIATMMHSQYVKHSDRANETISGWDAVNRFKTITLNPSLSTEELNAVKHTSYANRLSQIESIGLGPLLGCAEAVRTAFTDECNKHSWCGTLIKSAADWRRIGLGPASREQLTLLSLAHKDEAWEVADWDDIWNQATKFINHTVPLLRQVGDDRWEVLDTIADEANWAVSSHTLTSLKSIPLSEQQALRAAATMFLCGDPSLPTNDMFKLTLKTNPNNAIALGAYALFLETVRGDMDQAQDMYQRAVDADPTNAKNLGGYAVFLEHERGDMDQAQDMYQRAVDADPTNALALGSYATFLHTKRGDMDQAQDMYQRAVDADPNISFILRSYATFLEHERGDMDQAQDMYQRAVDADPTNALSLGSYATFLHTKRGDMDQAQNMYQRAVDADPTNANNLGDYAVFLEHERGDMDQAQDMYQRAIEADPTNANNLGSYAIFLETIQNNTGQADDIFQRAIKADPTNATTLGNYALFLHTARGEMDQAHYMFLEAIEANPRDAINLGNYATFLERVRGDLDQAQDMYQRAIDADPTNARILVRYAIFLETTRNNKGRADNIFQRAINADPTNATTFGNYALFLEIIRGDMDQAEQMYQRAINADPTNATFLSAYASFLKNIRGDMDQAQDMYQQAINADPTDATTLGNYAIFLETIRGNIDQAQHMYQQAMTADPHNTNNLGNYAVFLKDVRGNMDQAQDMYLRAINADPNNVDILGNYAQILFAKSDDTEAISLTEKAIAQADNDNTPLVTECHYYLFSHSPEHRKESGGALKALLAEGVTTGDWSFEMNLERVRREEDPRLELLEAVAQALRDGDMSRLDAFEEWRDL